MKSEQSFQIGILISHWSSGQRCGYLFRLVKSFPVGLFPKHHLAYGLISALHFLPCY